jgi:hypothetical protein
MSLLMLPWAAARRLSRRSPEALPVRR